MSGWKPIESAMSEAPHWFSEFDKGEIKTRHISEVLVCGHIWIGGWNDTPYNSNSANKWGEETVVSIATTYEGLPFWILANSGPQEYDEYIKPTHWMPLPAPAV